MIIKNKGIVRRFVPIRKDVKLPKASTQYSAGYDIFSPRDFELEHNCTETISTGLRYETTELDEFVALYPRSSLGFKNYCRLANTVGIIDADYEGEIKIRIRNEGYEPMIIKQGQAICQAVIQPYLKLEPDFRDSTKRGSGGFGSTDK